MLRGEISTEFKQKEINENIAEGTFLKDIAWQFKKKTNRALMRGIRITLIVILVIGTLFTISFKAKLFRVPNEDLQFKCYNVAKGGNIGGMLYIDDKDEKTLYLTVKRTLIKEKSIYGAEDTYFYGLGKAKPNKIYLGNEDDKLLIWDDNAKSEIKFITKEELQRISMKANEEYFKMLDSKK